MALAGDDIPERQLPGERRDRMAEAEHCGAPAVVRARAEEIELASVLPRRRSTRGSGRRAGTRTCATGSWPSTLLRWMSAGSTSSCPARARPRRGRGAVTRPHRRIPVVHRPSPPLRPGGDAQRRGPQTPAEGDPGVGPLRPRDGGRRGTTADPPDDQGGAGRGFGGCENKPRDLQGPRSYGQLRPIVPHRASLPVERREQTPRLRGGKGECLSR